MALRNVWITGSVLALVACVAVSSFAMTRGGGVGALPHHCNSDELQNQSCTNPGNCYNACAFWCRTLYQQCRACCAAFAAGTAARQRCYTECDQVWQQ